MADTDAPQRTKCAIMAIIPILNWFAIHKFMLGQTTPAIIQICLSVFTCGMGSLIAFIEGIIYFMKTDEEWHQIYVVDKKAWF